MCRCNHFNLNVRDLQRSLDFYAEALDLHPVRERSTDSYKLVYLGDGISDFTLELTWLFDRTEPYDLGEQEFHLALIASDYEAAYAKHQAMGCVCQPDGGRFYFIEDPDGYWIEILRG